MTTEYQDQYVCHYIILSLALLTNTHHHHHDGGGAMKN